MLTIGQFAKLSNVTTQTLRHYDKIGLLKPRKIDDINNYRFYSMDQLDKMHTIQLLKHSGYELKKIKEYFTSYSPKDMVSLMSLKSLELKKEIDQLTKLYNNLRRRTDLLEYATDDVNKDQITIKYLDERHIYDLQVTEEIVTYNYTILMNKLIEKVDEFEGYFTHSGLILAKEKVEKRKFRQYNKMFIILDEKTSDSKVIKAGNYITFLHRGSYASMGESYSLLLDYIKRNSYTIVGDTIDLGIVDPYITEDEDLYVTEIQIPIIDNAL